MVTLMRSNIFLVFVFIFSYLILNTYKSIKKDNTLLFENNINIGYFTSIILILSLTVFPISTTIPDIHVINMNTVPLKTIKLFLTNKNIIDILANIVGNTILFVPLGFFAYIKFNQSTIKSLAICIFFTVLVESIQLLLPHRLADVDDLILNTLGGIIGIIVSKIISYIINKIKDHRLCLRS